MRLCDDIIRDNGPRDMEEGMDDGVLIALGLKDYE